MPKKKPKRKRPEEKEALAKDEGLSDIPVAKPGSYIEPYKRIKYLGVSGIFKIRGPVTGIAYTFTAQERVSFVATEDYEALLQRARPARKCCGGKMIPAQSYFGPV